MRNATSLLVAPPNGERRGDMLSSLQILRGIAAVLVILAHVKFPLEATPNQLALPGILRGAGLACGVDLFFVLSGFVISMAADRQGVRPGSFLIHRAVRVLPMYWLAGLPYLVRLVWQGLAGDDISFRVIWNSLALVPVWDKFGINDPAHPFGWTLSFEGWFYLCFAGLLILRPARAVSKLIPLIFVVTIPLPFVWTAAWKFPYFAFHPLCWEFALGCLAYQVTRFGQPRRVFALLLFVTATLLLVTNATAFEELGWHGKIRMDPKMSALRVCVWGLPAFLLVLSSVWLEPWLPKGRVSRFFVFLGGASYSIYLLQPMAFEVMTRPIRNLGSSCWPLAGMLLVLVCLAAGLLAHLAVEKPLLRLLRRVVDRRLLRRHGQ